MKFHLDIQIVQIYLSTLGYTDSPLCPLCKDEPCDIDHRVWQCVSVNSLWTEVQHWTNTEAILQITFTRVSLILGYLTSSNVPLIAISSLITDFQWSYHVVFTAILPFIPIRIRFGGESRHVMLLYRCLTFGYYTSYL